MSCSSCMSGNFRGMAAYVPATARSYIATTGPVESVPNATGGMHLGPTSRLTDPGMSGLGDIFGANQTNLISGIPNEYLAVGAVLLLVLTMR